MSGWCKAYGRVGDVGFVRSLSGVAGHPARVASADALRAARHFAPRARARGDRSRGAPPERLRPQLFSSASTPKKPPKSSPKSPPPKPVCSIRPSALSMMTNLPRCKRQSHRRHLKRRRLVSRPRLISIGLPPQLWPTMFMSPPSALLDRLRASEHRAERLAAYRWREDPASVGRRSWVLPPEWP
jgi:hypothetical protein